MYVINRDGFREEFNPNKIENAIHKAFKACNQEPTLIEDNIIVSFCNSFNKNIEALHLETIQDEVEEFLMTNGWFKVAKAFILYRELHKQERFIEERLDYMDSYSENADNAATASETDPNSNVSTKNVATLDPEVYKTTNRNVQRRRMKRQMKKDFPEENIYKRYIYLLENHFIYVGDEASTPTIKFYCQADDLYPLMVDGIGTLDGGKTEGPPTDMTSFSGQLVNFIHAASGQCKGAVAVPSYLLTLNYYIIKEFGPKWYEKLDVVITNEHCVEQQTIWDRVRKAFKTFVYGVNQMAGNRGGQCVREDTELWTPTGFKHLSELNVGDECYVFDKETHRFKVEKIQQLNVFDFDGELIRFSSRDYQQTVTPNHRVLNYKTNSNELRLTAAQDLFEKTAIRVPTTGVLENPDYPISDEGIKIIACLYTDGSFSYEDGHGDPRARFYMSPNRNGLRILKSALNAEGISYNEATKVSKVSGTKMITIMPTKEDIRKYSQFVHYNKTILSEELFKFSKRQLDIFFDTWANIDGQVRNKDTNRYMLQCDNDDIADQIQRLATQAGYNNKMRFAYRRANGVFKESYTRYVVLYGRDKRTITKYEKIPYKGKIWCPTTEAGIVVFREENLMPYISGNSPFTNISYFDHTYFDGMFGDFYYPDGTKPEWEAVDKLQRLFMNWFNERRLKSVLTFPVETFCMVYDDKDYIDQDYKKLCAEMYAKGHSFFTYISDSVDSLASCCRLRNKLQKNTFSPTSGMTGLKTGSCNVITLNLNRIIQQCMIDLGAEKGKQITMESFNKDTFIKYLKGILEIVYKAHISFKHLLYREEDRGMYSVSNGGYIHMKDLYSTIGINGHNEAARFLGLDVSWNEPYVEFLQLILSTIKEQNELHSIEDKKYPIRFNSEVIPAESVGGKNYRWDAADGYWVPQDENLYNSYFYNAHDNTSVLDKFRLHGNATYQFTDGGSALHCNLEDHLTKEQYLKLLDFARENGTQYFTFNIPNSECDDCHFITKHPLTKCPKCGSEHITQYSRVIGYLTATKTWGSDRQIEGANRTYSDGKSELKDF